LLDALSTCWPTMHRAFDASFGSDFDATLPAAAVLGNALLRGLMSSGLVALIASFVAAKVKQQLLRALLFLGGALSLVGSNWGTPADFLKQFLARVIVLAILAFGVKYIARFNLLGMFLVTTGTTLLSAAAELLSQPDRFYHANGYAVVFLLILLLAWPFLAWRVRPAVVGT
jgi:hypothetical protein